MYKDDPARSFFLCIFSIIIIGFFLFTWFDMGEYNHNMKISKEREVEIKNTQADYKNDFIKEIPNMKVVLTKYENCMKDQYNTIKYCLDHIDITPEQTATLNVYLSGQNSIEVLIKDKYRDYYKHS